MWFRAVSLRYERAKATLCFSSWKIVGLAWKLSRHSVMKGRHFRGSFPVKGSGFLTSNLDSMASKARSSAGLPTSISLLVPSW